MGFSAAFTVGSLKQWRLNLCIRTLSVQVLVVLSLEGVCKQCLNNFFY